MYLLLIALPLIGALVSGLLGRHIGVNGAIRITTGCILVATALSAAILYEVGVLGLTCTIELFPWIEVGPLYLHWSFLFDSVTAIMAFTVLTVSLVVHIYSTGYMQHDPHIVRFMSYISLFTFFMLVLITAGNFVQMFAGWEGVGLCSYLLIGFWSTRVEANKAAIKAMVVNRVGDVGLLLGIIAIAFTFHSVDFATVFAAVPVLGTCTLTLISYDVNVINLICILLFVGAVGKSAQLGLHTWLPDAMEGPTPVSALIHAATMVTAGVFMVVRCSPLFEYAPVALAIMTIVGALTAFVAASIAVVQHDLKKVVAYSTCSQLGYMILACGVSGYSASIFHLMNHAFFKALLFLGAGCVIHALGDEQDMRKMGGLASRLPYTYIVMLIGALSLMGWPFLAGFYSKDYIIELVYAKHTLSASVAYLLGLATVCLTAFYSTRLILLTFVCRSNARKQPIGQVHEVPKSMMLSVFILALGSVFVGYIFKDALIGIGSDFWGNAVYVSAANIQHLEPHMIQCVVKNTPILLTLLGVLAAYFIHGSSSIGAGMSNVILSLIKRSSSVRSIYRMMYIYIYIPVYKLLVNKYYFDHIINGFIVSSLYKLGYNITYKLIDRGVLELLGPTGVSRAVAKLVRLTSRLHSGLIYNYAITMMVFVVLAIALVSASGLCY